MQQEVGLLFFITREVYCDSELLSNPVYCQMIPSPFISCNNAPFLLTSILSFQYWLLVLLCHAPTSGFVIYLQDSPICSPSKLPPGHRFSMENFLYFSVLVMSLWFSPVRVVMLTCLALK